MRHVYFVITLGFATAGIAMPPYTGILAYITDAVCIVGAVIGFIGWRKKA